MQVLLGIKVAKFAGVRSRQKRKLIQLTSHGQVGPENVQTSQQNKSWSGNKNAGRFNEF
jgi:hypothetical protein